MTGREQGTEDDRNGSGLSRENSIIVVTADIVPTVLGVLGIGWKAFGQFEGESLVPLIAEGKPVRRLAHSGGNHGRAALMLGGCKYSPCP